MDGWMGCETAVSCVREKSESTGPPRSQEMAIHGWAWDRYQGLLGLVTICAWFASWASMGVWGRVGMVT